MAYKILRISFEKPTIRTQYIGSPTLILKMIVSLHEYMKATIQSDGNTSNSFEVKTII